MFRGCFRMLITLITGGNSHGIFSKCYLVSAWRRKVLLMEIQILIQSSEEYLETVNHIKHSFYIACSVENLDFIFLYDLDGLQCSRTLYHTKLYYVVWIDRRVFKRFLVHLDIHRKHFKNLVEAAKETIKMKK